MIFDVRIFDAKGTLKETIPAAVLIKERDKKLLKAMSRYWAYWNTSDPQSLKKDLSVPEGVGSE